jgi:GNAT superfamily N-acetyltransferase
VKPISIWNRLQSGLDTLDPVDRASPSAPRLVPPAVVRPLRQTVLRPGRPPEESVYDGDDHPLAGHVAVMAHGSSGPEAVLAVGSLFPEDPPAWLAEEAQMALGSTRAPGAARRWWRVRGMATADGHRGQGLGASVLGALLEHVADQRGGAVWCNARVPAVEFYVRAGFRPAGEVFVLPDIGPHQVMWRAVAAGWDTERSPEVP